MQYYPEQRHLLEMTTIQREQALPEDAIGSVEQRQGASVNLRDVVARGRMPSRYVIVEAAKELRLKDPSLLGEYMKVSVGDMVEIKTPLAELPNQRSKRLLSPIAGIVADVSDGRIVLQTMPEVVELEAGLDGQIVRINQGRGQQPAGDWDAAHRAGSRFGEPVRRRFEYSVSRGDCGDTAPAARDGFAGAGRPDAGGHHRAQHGR